MDIEGNPRPNPVGSFCDIGAYESNLGISTLIAAKSSKFPDEFKLFQNYPNPFNLNTQISFRLAESQTVSLDVFNLIGQRVAILISDKNLSAGYHSVEVSGIDRFSGTYFHRLTTENGVLMKRMILMK